MQRGVRYVGLIAFLALILILSISTPTDQRQNETDNEPVSGPTKNPPTLKGGALKAKEAPKAKQEEPKDEEPKGAAAQQLSAGSVQGRVLGPDGKPMKGISVMAYSYTLYPAGSINRDLEHAKMRDLATTVSKIRDQMQAERETYQKALKGVTDPAKRKQLRSEYIAKRDALRAKEREARAAVTGSSSGKSGFSKATFKDGSGISSRRYRQISDEDGRFLFAGLTKENVRIHIGIPEHNPIVITRSLDEGLDLGDLQLQPHAGHPKVQVTLDGKALVGARLIINDVTDRPQYSFDVRTDENGYADAAQLQTGHKYWIIARTKGQFLHGGFIWANNSQIEINDLEKSPGQFLDK